MPAALGKLETVIGYNFKDATLLERALTHRSWANENIAGTEAEVAAADNESLEFIGDSVLGLAVAEQLFVRNPGSGEGDLTLMKHKLVSGAALAELSETLGIGEYVRLGGSEADGGRQKRSLLTNTFEAVIGAVFMDGGYIAARNVVTRLMEELIRSATPEDSVDFKSRFQAELQSRKKKPATYTLVKTEGPPHSRTFFVKVEWDGGNAAGHGNSIKAAEMMAAAEGLQKLD